MCFVSVSDICVGQVPKAIPKHERMCEELRLERYDNSPWGFRLTGGLDFGTPLSIIKVTGGSIAEEAGVKAGDLVKNINGKPTTHFTHLDAQKCISSSRNYLTLTVVRGSIVTPPTTPLRGLSPALSHKNEENHYYPESPIVMKTDMENKIMEYYNHSRDMRDGSRSPVQVQTKATGQQATMTNKRYSVNDEGQLLLGDRALSDFEIAELLTSNEEVLDEGILGINFKKFLPKVDFIRNSEVFKMLQNENTKKELSEQAQLQKDPNKRFSTFLMKPRAPPERPKNLEFVRFKPPRYLPKRPDPKWELPKLKPWERPKRKDPEHAVLWLFLEEKGEEVIDERWGTDEEERMNMSRNSYVEFDRSSMSSSMRMHEDDTCSLASRDQYEATGRVSADVHDAEHEEHDDARSQCQSRAEEHHLEDSSHDQVVQEENRSEEERLTQERNINTKLVEQLAEIQHQIAALENEAPSDLQTQLMAVKEQLSRIVQIKTNIHEMQEMHKVEEVHEETSVAESFCSRHEEEITEHSEKHEVYESHEEHMEEAEEHVEIRLPSRKARTQEITQSESVQIEKKSEKRIDVSTYQVEQLEEEEIQLCITPSPVPPSPRPPSPPPKVKAKPRRKPRAQPITPQLRPIVLPGGRMWRQPKDAEHEEFYQGILVAQAEVLIGSDEGLNYTKYMPPKVDMTTSQVYKLIHETEDKEHPVDSDSPEPCPPISKRHFYAARLKPPPPIGAVELSDL